MRLGDEERHELFERFATSGVLEDVRVVSADELADRGGRTRELVFAVEGTRTIADRRLRLRVGVCDRFPHLLPHVFVADRTGLPFIPHLEHDGRVCAFVEEGLVLRSGDPRAVLEDAAGKAIETLAKGLAGENSEDVYDELDRYWLAASTFSPPTPTWVEADGSLRKVVVAFERPRRGRDPVFRYVAGSFADVQEWDPQFKSSKTEYTGMYVPLEPSVLGEAIDPAQFDDAGWVRDFVARHITPSNQARLLDPVAHAKTWPFVVLGIPRATHPRRTLVGLYYEHVQGGHPLTTGTTPHPVRKVVLERRDASFLHERGGALRRLQESQVVVVGCGAIGGHVALNLATSGVGRILLVDSDTLKPENTFRHVLGKSAVGENKARALKAEIERRFPYVKVEAVKDDVLRANLTWDEYDVVIATTGDITVSRWLNPELARAGTAAVFAWLEPLGIGGHALLTHVQGPGCYECLFRDAAGDEQLNNAADFAAPGQEFARSLAGCSSTFTPYGALDASRTAELATRIAIAALTDEEHEHAIRSWKGSAVEFTKTYTTSNRFALDERDLHATRLAYVNPCCPVCSGRP